MSFPFSHLVANLSLALAITRQQFFHTNNLKSGHTIRLGLQLLEATTTTTKCFRAPLKIW